MAHIVSCMLNTDTEDLDLSLKNYIEKPVTPQTSNDSLLEKATNQGSEKPAIWRMHQPERKYQLFPKERQPAASPGKALDPEQAFALAMGQNGDKTDKSSTGGGLRIRIKEHNLIRRRKVSVPELGPMTTVQEVAMDSPTIPGRPPLHERSISAPGSSWKQHNLSETITFSEAQTPDEKAEMEALGMYHADSKKAFAPQARAPLSPKSLAPLVIPSPAGIVPRLTTQASLGRLRSGSTPAEPTIRSARTDDSPRARTPFTPLSASTTVNTPRSAAISAVTVSTLPTPISAPIESRSSPRPWEKPTNYALVSNARDGAPEANPTPKAEPELRVAPPMGHRRNLSESASASVMERGRPRKRSETTGCTTAKRSGSRRSSSAERRAFEQLPRGWKASEAASMLTQSEAAALQKQALQQAARFEILRKDDVDNLSTELRHLDERTEYLRRTYTSLRSGRRNLHSRICQYLRSPRTAKFSHDSILKQEEALAELDASIDDWVTKLEQAENRRTRVRQKLLEHVAAAATLPLNPGIFGVSHNLHLAMGIRSPDSANSGNPANLSTPPRSPTKLSFSAHTQSSSPSPQRVVAQVPSTILEQPLFEEAATIGCCVPGNGDDTVAPLRRAETIRIYADNDVYALLADVEDQITKMGVGDVSKEASLSDDERRELHRARSQELLNGSLERKSSNVDLQTPPSPTKQETIGDCVLLTNAVFKPGNAVAAL